ncbi:hypothetical protein GCM10011273_07240 [Asticcacaulis endophyticus]|uniref:Uncharacterized protein n=1 Tax=Asticcacaulis endophyticus TaxID=1395890 RepID=A0A918PXJ9_9CAUL|nr:hypothetical protein GCM10011273_07240 [Asticcacaulis endophyticus]
MRVKGSGAAIQLFDIRVIGRLRQDARDDAALIGHAHAFFNALLFDTIHEDNAPVFSFIRRGFNAAKPNEAQV